MARKETELAKASEFAFDYTFWHNGPTCVVTIIPHAGWGALVCCTTHKTVAPLEAIGERITYDASKKEATL